MKRKRELEMRSGQGGGVLVLFGISLAVLIGFLGIVVDLGRLFVTKTELQTAMDACALAAASELRPGLKVLFASGYFEGALVSKGALETDVQFIAKPYRMKALAQCM